MAAALRYHPEDCMCAKCDTDTSIYESWGSGAAIGIMRDRADEESKCMPSCVDDLMAAIMERVRQRREAEFLYGTLLDMGYSLRIEHGTLTIEPYSELMEAYPELAYRTISLPLRGVLEDVVHDKETEKICAIKKQGRNPEVMRSL